MSLKFRVALAAAFAVLAVVAFASYADQVREEADQVRSEAIARYGGEVVNLVVATRQIEAGETVSSSDVETREWLADLAPEGAVTNPDEVVGLRLSVPAGRGAPLTSLNLREDEDSIEVPSGHIAVGVPLSERMGVSGDTSPGTAVVAYATSEAGTTLLASDMVVLSVSKGGAGGSSVSIAVMPDDVARVLSASAEGELRLVVPASDVSELPKGDEAAPSKVDSVSEEGK